jgi:adenylate cyclase
MKISVPINYFLKKKACVTLGFFLIYCMPLFSQNQQAIDSLEQIYNTGQYNVQDKLTLLKQLAFSHTDLDKALRFSEELILNAQQANSTIRLYNGYFYKGNALTRKGNLSEALENYFKGAEIAAELNENYYMGEIYIPIADVYSTIGNHKNAAQYYKKAISIHEKNDSIKELAIALNNLGDEYLNVFKPDSALLIFEKSGPVFKRLGFKEGIAMTIGNKGIAYALQGRDDLAKDEINHAIKMFVEMENYYYAISIFLSYMSDLYLSQNDLNTALTYAERSLELSNKQGLKDEISKANLQLSKIYEISGENKKSLTHYKNYIVYKDSVNNIASVQQMADIRADFEIEQQQIQSDFEVAQKQIEVDLLNQQKRNQRIAVIAISIALAFIIVLAIGLFRRNKFIEKTKLLVEKEKDRSDKLLLNILPEQTAIELKEQGKVKAKKFDSVSVMFTDFKGFTRLSEGLNPEELVETVDFYYSKFDEIIKSYGLEKIKTIGDAYMAASGLPFPTKDHATKLTLAALEIAEFVKNAKEENPNDEKRFEIRIGINTGPVVAGVVGTNKFAYDIWGDTVNIASRMESNSKPGKVNISENTYQLIKGNFKCAYRGEIDAKNRGKMKMYFVNSIKGAELNLEDTSVKEHPIV